MTYETLEKAVNIKEKIKEIDDILERLNTATVRNLQKKDVIAEEDLKTSVSLCVNPEMQTRTNGIPFSEFYLTNEHIEIMKQAFKKRKSELNMEFCEL